MANREPQGCLLAIIRLLGLAPGDGTSDDESHGDSDTRVQGELPYRVRDDFLTAAEFSFYKVMIGAVGERAVLLAKVNLGDLFYVVRAHDNRTYRNKIDRKHVDFLLCDPQSMRPLCGVELDDSIHARPDRQDRDDFVDDVFLAAGLSLVRVPVQAAYQPKALLALLEPALSDRPALPLPVAVTVSGASPTCQKCGGKMVQRVAQKGPNAGKPFWGCENYPRCKHMIGGS